MMATNKTKTHNEAFQSGRDAFQRGAPLSSCGFSSTHLRAAFTDGWHDAATDASVAKVLSKPAVDMAHEMKRLDAHIAKANNDNQLILTHRCGFMGCTTPVKQPGSRCDQHAIVDDAQTPARFNALRELVRAEQARTQALLDMQAQLPNLSPAAFDAMKGYASILANSKDWRDVDVQHVAELLKIIKQA